MIKTVVTFLTSLIASFFNRKTDRFCLRKVAAALLVFQVISLGAILIHMNTSIHIHSPYSGEVIHISATLNPVAVDEHPIVQSDTPITHEDVCELFHQLLRPSAAQTVSDQPIIADPVIISHEVIARKLDIVYRSTRLLQQAPKNSPPCSLS